MSLRKTRELFLPSVIVSRARIRFTHVSHTQTRSLCQSVDRNDNPWKSRESNLRGSRWRRTSGKGRKAFKNLDLGGSSWHCGTSLDLTATFLLFIFSIFPGWKKSSKAKGREFCFISRQFLSDAETHFATHTHARKWSDMDEATKLRSRTVPTLKSRTHTTLELVSRSKTKFKIRKIVNLRGSMALANYSDDETSMIRFK